MARTAAAGHSVGRCFLLLYTPNGSRGSEVAALVGEGSGRARIVVGYDGSEPAKRALERGAPLADDRALIVVVAVAEPYQAAESRSRPTSTGLRPAGGATISMRRDRY